MTASSLNRSDIMNKPLLMLCGNQNCSFINNRMSSCLQCNLDVPRINWKTKKIVWKHLDQTPYFDGEAEDIDKNVQYDDPLANPFILVQPNNDTTFGIIVDHYFSRPNTDVRPSDWNPVFYEVTYNSLTGLGGELNLANKDLAVVLPSKYGSLAQLYFQYGYQQGRYAKRTSVSVFQQLSIQMKAVGLRLPKAKYKLIDTGLGFKIPSINGKLGLYNYLLQLYIGNVSLRKTA